MKRIATLLLAVFCLTLGFKAADARRGNPTPNDSPEHQYYVVDSDDDDPRAPTYMFVDTTVGTWHRVNNLTGGTDNGYVSVVSATDSIKFWDQNIYRRLPPRFMSTNGVLKLTIDTFDVAPDTSALNTAFPVSYLLGVGAIVCPLWGDLEFRTTGDSSKVFYRMTTDSCYITYYNIFLKGTNGQVHATFQVAFSNTDSSITFYYKSFDGSFADVSGAMLFEKTCSIGLQNYQSIWGTTYLDRGIYYAKSYSSQIYAKDLHNQLAVRFQPIPGNMIRLKSIDFPPYNRYEMTSNQFKPVVTVENLLSSDYHIVINNKVTNLETGVTFYSRTDSNDVGFNSTFQDTGSLYSGFPCGMYRMTTTISIPTLGIDSWTPDNTLTRDFVLVSPDNMPYFDDFNTALDPCYWHVDGATWVSAPGAITDQPGPDFIGSTSTGSVLLNRRDFFGNPYPSIYGADTMTTGPLNLSSASNVWMCFSYQRGSSSDTTLAGVTQRYLVGPEAYTVDSNGSVVHGDSLVVEALRSNAPKFNTVDSNWVKIAAIYGGLDLTTQKFRMQIPSTYLHDHSRFRLRLVAKNDVPLLASPPFDDDDNWIVDGFQLNDPAPSSGSTELEPYWLDLGNGLFTHVPRTIKWLTPRVKIGSNAWQTNIASYNVRLIITDALGRQVYHQLQTLYSPASHHDTTISFPKWEIEGSQGGQFTAKMQMELNFNEIRRQNDTVILYRTLYIDDKYAYDDGTPDTSGSMVAADSHFFIDLKPLASDSLRSLEFFHLDATGTTNWSMTIKGSGNNTIATRTFTYNELQRGLIRGTFNPIYLSSDSLYHFELNMTQGSGLGGDGSRGLVWPIKTGSSPKYSGLYPTLLGMYKDANGNKYLVDSNSTARNAAAGGPILPMVRFVFQGSSTYLPIELASFTAMRSSDGEVLLNFQTAKESDVSSYVLDRETASGWVTVATLKAENAQLGAAYDAIDARAPYSKVTYRLTEVDLDGSQKIAGYTTASPFGLTSPLSISVTPNPASSRIHVVFSGMTEPAELKLYDVIGRVVLTTTTANTDALDLDVSALAAGQYTLQVVTAGEERRTSLIIQK